MKLIGYAVKVASSYNARDVGMILTERIGGQGYLMSNRICELISFSHWAITGEGDNKLLM